MAKFDIRAHIDRLTPAKEKGKYFCPVCEGHNLSIRQKDGAYNCWDNGCDAAAIARKIAPELYQSKSSRGFASGAAHRKRQKTQKEKDRDTQVNSARVECQVDELIRDIGLGYKTAAEAGVELAAWCKENGCDCFTAKKLLQERLIREQQDKEKQASPPLAELGEAIDNLVAQDLDGSELTIRLQGLSEEFRKPPQSVEKLFYQKRREQEVTEAARSVAADLKELNQTQQSRLPIRAGLHGDGGRLAEQLIKTAEAMPTAPEFLATTLIPVLASRIGTSHSLAIHASAGYVVRPIFRTLVVAETGRKKTPAQKAIISALTELERRYNEIYQQALENYERELEAWKPGTDTPKPKPPIRRRYVSTDDTLAARIKSHGENPRGLLLYRDEGSAFIAERGRFSSGKGDGGETEADLSEFNGGMLSRDRKVDGSIFLAKTGISRTGAIQYAKIERLMGDHRDDCGEWARYLVCAADAPLAYIDLLTDTGDTGLKKSLIDLVQWLDELPEADYLLSHGAKLAFMQYQRLLIDRLEATDHPSLKAALPKFETYFGRFILLLHVVNGVLAGDKPAPVVDAHTVELACQWTEYYFGQFKLLMAVNSPQQELTGDLLQLQTYLKRKPGRDIRQIVQAKLFDASNDKSKKGTSYIRSLLSTLTEQGYVKEADGKYAPASDEMGHPDPSPQASPAEPLFPQESQASQPAAPSEPCKIAQSTSKLDIGIPTSSPAAPSEPVEIAVDTPVTIAYPPNTSPPLEGPPPGAIGFVSGVSGGAAAVCVGEKFYRNIPIDWLCPTAPAPVTN